MLKFSEIFEFSRENSYFERIRMVRMVRMVRSLADRTFQLWLELIRARRAAEDDAADGVPGGAHAVNAIREHLVPEQRVIDVREARPAKSPSQAAPEIHHENHGPSVAVKEEITCNC